MKKQILVIIAGVLCMSLYAGVDNCAGDNRACSHKTLDSGKTSCDNGPEECNVYNMNEATCNGGTVYTIELWQDTEISDGTHQLVCYPGTEYTYAVDQWVAWNNIGQNNTACKTPYGCSWNNTGTSPICAKKSIASGAPTYKNKKSVTACAS